MAKWLGQYKFKNWSSHRDGRPVTTEEKAARAAEIAEKLCNHRKWLTHRRSLRISDLEAMGLRITDYSLQPELDDAITRYYTLLHMTFASNIYKLFETPGSQIYRFVAPQTRPRQVLSPSVMLRSQSSRPSATAAAKTQRSKPTWVENSRSRRVASRSRWRIG